MSANDRKTGARTARLLDGRSLSSRLRAEAKTEIQALIAQGVQPHLVSVQVGEDDASGIYIRNQARACRKAGVRYTRMQLDADTPEAEIVEQLQIMNESPAVTGLILQMPLPEHVDSRIVQQAIAPDLDVEGVTPRNLGRLVQGQREMIPCTPAAVMEMLALAEVDLRGAEVCVVGHSEIVGKPIALLLLDAFATVTVCHIATQDLAAHTREADILITAVGKPGLITAAGVREGATVVDVGISMVPREGTSPGEKGGMRIVGDVDYESVVEKAGALTPVPGGVGPVTTAMLLRNVARASQHRVSAN